MVAARAPGHIARHDRHRSNPMTDTLSDPLALYSDRVAALVETAARSVVAVHGGGRRSTSAIHWRPGILVTAEEALEREDDITVTLPDGRRVAATLAGRDPSTDVAVLRFPPDGLAVAQSAAASALRPGHFVLAVGRHEGGPIASHGIAGFVGGAWRSQRGGTIDHLLRLDLNLSPAAEGGALVDTAGRVLGMTVLGPRRRALAIPASTVDRAVDQLLAKGHVARGYLGAALQRVRLGSERGVLVIGIDADGPAARAGLLVGDAIVGWNGTAVTRVREIMRLLGTDSVGTAVELGLVRGGQKLTLGITIGERPLR
jgi:S1-C subfamily serine protease